MKKALQKLLTLLFLLIVSEVVSQDIISADGHSMGPKYIFLEVCNENMGETLTEVNDSFSKPVFCNCMADELIPTLTKKQIEYYFKQGHMHEMFNDSRLKDLILECVFTNSKNTFRTPPPSEMMSPEENEHLIDQIVIICDYNSAFNSIRDELISKRATQKNWSEKKINEIKSKINFHDVDKHVFYSGYSIYSHEDLREVLNLFKNMSKEDLDSSTLKHEELILRNLKNMISNKLNELEK
jgi:hypothetical protein